MKHPIVKFADPFNDNAPRFYLTVEAALEIA